MSRASISVLIVLSAIAAGSAGCTHGNRPIKLEHPAEPPASRLSDVASSLPGAHVVAYLFSGVAVQGTVEAVSGNVLVLRVDDDAASLRLAEDGIVCLARRVTKSTTTRGWLGALIGATATLPFGISMVGDMVMPGAIAGALVAGNTGQPRARVVLDRGAFFPDGLQSCRTSMPTR
jgi:hypothetical protein